MHRYFNRIVEKLLSPEDRKALIEKESFRVINPDMRSRWFNQELIKKDSVRGYTTHLQKLQTMARTIRKAPDRERDEALDNPFDSEQDSASMDQSKKIGDEEMIRTMRKVVDE